MEKLKVSFEPTKSYNRQEFRDFLKRLSYDDPCETCEKFNIELYLITANSSSVYINAIAKQYNLDAGHTIIVGTIVDKIQTIKDLNIDIHFENNQEDVNEINVQTNAYSILVDSTIDFYMLGFKYITKFNNILKIKAREEKEDN